MTRTRRSRREPRGVNWDQRVTELSELHPGTPYRMVVGAKVTEVLVMSEPYAFAFHHSDVFSETLALDVVTTDGTFERIFLDTFGLTPHPDGRKTITRDYALLTSNRAVSALELSVATETCWYQSRDYKMGVAGALARIFLNHPRVLRVGLYGSLARGRNGRDIDLVLAVSTCTAYENLARAERERQVGQSGFTALTSTRLLNPKLVKLLRLTPSQSENLERLINAGCTYRELNQLDNPQLWDRCLKLDLQILPDDAGDRNFRERFRALSSPNKRGFKNEFLTEIARDLLFFDPAADRFPT